MRTRSVEWYDSEQHRVLHGVQVKTAQGWAHVHENGAPCLYPDKKDADALRVRLRREKREDS